MMKFFKKCEKLFTLLQKFMEYCEMFKRTHYPLHIYKDRSELYIYLQNVSEKILCYLFTKLLKQTYRAS